MVVPARHAPRRLRRRLPQHTTKARQEADRLALDVLVVPELRGIERVVHAAPLAAPWASVRCEKPFTSLCLPPLGDDGVAHRAQGLRARNGTCALVAHGDRVAPGLLPGEQLLKHAHVIGHEPAVG